MWSSRPRTRSCNPYLALGGIIAAGLDGMERGLEDLAHVDLRRPGNAERLVLEERGIVRLPRTPW